MTDTPPHTVQGQRAKLAGPKAATAAGGTDTAVATAAAAADDSSTAVASAAAAALPEADDAETSTIYVKNLAFATGGTVHKHAARSQKS